MNLKEKTSIAIGKFLSKHSKLTSIITLVLGAIAPVVWNYLLPSCRETVFNNFGWAIDVLLLLFLLLFYCLRYTVRPDKISDKKKIYSHPILVVDDNGSDLMKIDNELDASFKDVVLLKDLSDYRLVEKFEVIVCDIMDIGRGKSSKEILEQVSIKYPYKKIIAMSSQPAAVKLSPDIEIIEKDKRFPLEILDQVKKACQELDDPAKHIFQIKYNLLAKGVKEEEIEKLEQLYVNSLPDK